MSTPQRPPDWPTTPAAPRPRVPHNTFADPTLMAGRSLGIWVYVGALLLAALADFANFYQIIQFAMRDQDDRRLLLMVIGFTACVLFLAHAAGVMFRTLRAGETWIPWILPALAVLIWFGLGLCGLYLRLHHQDAIAGPPPVQVIPAPGASASGVASPEVSLAPTAASAPSGGAFPVVGSALVFLGLYLGTGLVAAIGGYLTHNPARAAFAKAKREYEKAVGAAADSARSYAEAAGELELQEMRGRNANLMRRAEEIELMHIAEELKQRTRTAIAERTQDAGLTDAYFPEDDDD